MTISDVTADNKPYDGTNAANLNSVGVLQGVFASDALKVTLHTDDATATFVDKKAGLLKPVTVNGFTLNGDEAGDYSLTQPSYVKADIAKIPLVVSAIVNSKPYDGNDKATISENGLTIEGIAIHADGVEDVRPDYASAKAHFVSKDADEAEDVNVTGIQLIGIDAVNYTWNSEAATNADITYATLKVINVTAKDKTYDGNNTAEVIGTPQLNPAEIFGTDKVILTRNGNVLLGNFTDKNVGTNLPVTVTGTVFDIEGADVLNYILEPLTLSANINPIHLSISGVTANNKVYDGNKLAELIGTPKLEGVIVANEVVALDLSHATGTFANKNVGIHEVIPTGYTLTGKDVLSNYTLTQPSAVSAGISAKMLAVTATAANKVYNGSELAAATLSITPVSGEVVTAEFVGATFSDKKAADAKTVTVTGIKLTGVDAANYTADATATTTANITAKPLTVTAIAANKVYDGTTTATVTLSDNHLLGDMVTTSKATAVFDNKNVGTGIPVTVNGILISGDDALNYTYNTTASATADITSAGLAALTIKGVTVNSKVYDGTTTATLNTTAAALSGVISPDVVTLNKSNAAGTFANMNVGSEKVVTSTGFVLGGADAGNYTMTNPTITTSITAKQLTITPTSISKCFGATPTLSTTAFTPVGLIGNDAVSSVTLTSNGTSATAVVGTSAIVASSALGTGLSNYSINYVDGVMTVNPLAIQPAAFAVSTASVCQGSSAIAYSVPNDPTVTYNWSYSGTGATITGTTNAVTLNFSATATTGNLSVTATNACGTSTARSMAITAFAAPATPVISVDAVLQVTMTSNATAGNQWYNVISGLITGATAQTYRAPSNGNYYVMVTGNCSTIKSNIVNVTHVAIPEFEKSAINVYPNPNQGEFYVNFKASGNEKLKMIQVYNRLGKAVYQATPSSVSNELTERVSIKNQPAGVYILVLTTDNQRISRQIVITK